MNPLTQINTNEIIKEYKNTNIFKLPYPYTGKNKESFIEHSMALFAKLTLVKNHTDKYSAHKTLYAIPKEMVIDGVNVSEQTIINLIWIFVNVQRSKITSNPRFHSLTPIFMYAHKLYNNVTYDQWDRTDTKAGAFTSPLLRQALTNSLQFSMTPQFDDIKMLRETLTKGKKYTDYPLRSLKYMWVEHDDELGETTYIIEQPLLILMLQLWHANVDKRLPKAMMLDMFSWGVTPPAMDAARKDDSGSVTIEGI